MSRKTDISANALKEAILRFVRVGGASIISFILLGLAGMAQVPEVLLATAVIVALDKYFRDKGFYGGRS